MWVGEFSTCCSKRIVRYFAGLNIDQKEECLRLNNIYQLVLRSVGVNKPVSSTPQTREKSKSITSTASLVNPATVVGAKVWSKKKLH